MKSNAKQITASVVLCPQTILQAERSALPEILTSLGQGDLETFAGPRLYLLEQILDVMCVARQMRDPKLETGQKLETKLVDIGNQRCLLREGDGEPSCRVCGVCVIMFHQCFHCFSSCQVCGVSLGARKIGSDTPIQRDIRDVWREVHKAYKICVNVI